MGYRTEKKRAYYSSAAAEARVSQEFDRRQAAERNLAYQEQIVGTPEQAAGELGGAAPGVQPYLGRYQLDESYVTQLKGVPYLDATLFERNLGTANTLMEQAQAAAVAGNFEEAERLKQQAAGGITAGNIGILASAGQMEPAFRFVESPEMIGRSRLGSPMAQTVGGLVLQGREFLDPESETSTRFKRSLTEGGERAIAAESRGAQRSARDAMLARGSARNPYAEQAVAARTAEGFATARADLHSEANQYFESFSRQFAMDTTNFAQSWLRNQGELRTEHQAALNDLANQSVGLRMRSSEMSWEMARESQRQQGSGTGQAIGQIAGMIIAGALTWWAGGSGAAIFAAAAGGGAMGGGFGKSFGRGGNLWDVPGTTSPSGAVTQDRISHYNEGY